MELFIELSKSMEEVTQKCSIKTVFSKVLQNSQSLSGGCKFSKKRPSESDNNTFEWLYLKHAMVIFRNFET